MSDEAPHLLNSLDETLAHWSQRRGLPRFRVQQVRQWLFKRRAVDWDEMTDLPKALRRELAAELPLWSSQVLRHTRADDGTEKLLLQFPDGAQIE